MLYFFALSSTNASALLLYMPAIFIDVFVKYLAIFSALEPDPEANKTILGINI
jgi:hypothetical protein